MAFLQRLHVPDGLPAEAIPSFQPGIADVIVARSILSGGYVSLISLQQVYPLAVL